MANVYSETHTIHKLLTSGVFEIPWYQRYYDWNPKKDKNVKQLLTDTWQAANQKDNFYFLGSVILTEKKHGHQEYIEIIDGQQRLITLSLLFNALGRHFSYGFGKNSEGGG